MLSAAADRFVARVAHWSPARWARPAVHRLLDGAGDGGAVDGGAIDVRAVDGGAGDGGAVSRADVVFSLVQRLADLVATAEGRAPRPVPRLDNDLALTDQVRVMVADLLVADPPAEVLHAAATSVDATLHAL